MEAFLKILALAAGPIMGAIIGIFTNYIAIKMLFRPYTERYIGKFHVPFTPGIIPRRQEALAGALGQMVSERLVRDEDLKEKLLSEEFSGTVINSILSLPPIKDSGKALVGSSYEVQRNRLLNGLVSRIAVGISSLDLAEIFKREGVGVAASLAQSNPLIAMFVNEKTVGTIAAPLAERVQLYLEGDGKVKLRDLLEKELTKIEEKPFCEMLGSREQTEKLLLSVYRRLITDHADAIASHFRIADIVANRVRAMHPSELEKLVLSVMKNELNDVIRLGGVIGFVLGIITTVISFI